MSRLNYLQKIGLDAVGLDARPRGEKVNNTVAGRAEQLPFRDDVFDLIHAHAVFDAGVYNQDQETMVKEIERVLKPEGIFYTMHGWKGPTWFNQHFDVVLEDLERTGHNIYKKRFSPVIEEQK